MSTHSTRRGGPYDARYQKLRRLLIARHPWCTDCGARSRLELDHVVPLMATDGTHPLDPADYQVVCHRCNCLRRDRWLAAQGRKPFTRKPGGGARNAVGVLAKPGTRGITRPG